MEEIQKEKLLIKNNYILKNNDVILKIENFEGPLDLLCYLIDKNKLNIYEIEISEIANQYINYLKEMEKYSLEIASEFIVMASHLIYLKSKKILPNKEKNEVDEEEELRNQIIEYKKYKENLPFFQKQFEENRNIFTKEPEKIVKQKIEFNENIKLDILTDVYKKLVFNLNNKKNLNAKNIEKIALHENYSVKDKIIEILKSVLKNKKINFNKMFSKKEKTKNEIVTAFLGALELSRKEKIKLEQEENFDDIIIKKGK